jgi:hypothetical protein
MTITKEQVLQAVARGWCHEQNAYKTMDADLAFSIADEVFAAFEAGRKSAVSEPVAYIRKDQLQKSAQSALLCEVTPEPRQDRIGIYTTPPAAAVSKPIKPVLWVSDLGEGIETMTTHKFGESWTPLYITPPAAMPLSAPMQEQYLLNGTRFKLNFDGEGTVFCFRNYFKELQGRWVALVAAENDMHLQDTPPAAPLPWQPIETAPKDSKILLWGRYWNNTDVFQHPMVGMWNTNYQRWECNFNCWFGVHPTHWMPLPPPPNIGAKEQ